jgi:hypothetical protein
MKTYLTYGSAMAGGGFVLVMVLYILGLHSDPAKLSIAQWVQTIVGLGISITCIVLGTKARRSQVPPAEEFSYGSALGAGVMISVVASLIGIATTYLYAGVINPGFVDVLLQAQANQLEASGMSADKIEQLQSITAIWMKPAALSALGFLSGVILGTLISLITAAFLKRPASEFPPVAA